MMGWGYRGMMGGWFWMMPFCIILMVLIVYVVAKVFSNSKERNGIHNDNSMQILNERFARGEINEEEYNRKKEILMKK